MINYTIMNKRELFDSIYDRIENCSSLEYILKNIKENIDILDKEDIIKILFYYNSFKSNNF